MSICIFNVQIRGKKSQGAVIGLIFLVLSVVAYTVYIQSIAVSIILGLNIRRLMKINAFDAINVLMYVQ